MLYDIGYTEHNAKRALGSRLMDEQEERISRVFSLHLFFHHESPLLSGMSRCRIAAAMAFYVA